MTRVAVVGAGVTGLALAHYLDREGVSCRVFEADDEPGGVIRSGRIQGCVLEWGPQRLRLSDPLADLVGDLDLTDELIVADEDLPLFVYADGALGRVPTSLKAFVTTDLLSWRGKLRVLAEPMTSRGDETESAAELFTRKFGSEAYRKLIGPLFGGVYASDPAEMPARHSLAGMLRLEREAGSLLRAAIDRIGSERPPPASFDEGLQRLPEALADRLGDVVSFDTPVRSVDQNDDGYRLETSDGTVDADRIVLTTPADETAELLSDVVPETDSLSTLTYNPLAIVHLQSDVDAEGMGYQVGYDEDLHTLGVSWNGPMFDRDGVFTAFLGGMRDAPVLERSADELGEIASREFRTVMDAGARVLQITRLSRGFPAYDHTWDALDDLDLPEGIHLATNYTGRMGVPSRIREASSLASRLHSSLEAVGQDPIEAPH